MGTDDDSHHEEEGKYPRHQSKAGQSSGLSGIVVFGFGTQSFKYKFYKIFKKSFFVSHALSRST